MIQSLNKKVDLTIGATSFLGGNSYGKVMVGETGFEFYNERTARDYIQIPWTEVDQVIVSVIFNRFIPRFAIKTKGNGTFSFATKDSKKTLRAIREYIDANKIVKSLSFWQAFSRGIKSIFSRNK